jgi:hypothetical protein
MHVAYLGQDLVDRIRPEMVPDDHAVIIASRIKIATEFIIGSSLSDIW